MARMAATASTAARARSAPSTSAPTTIGRTPGTWCAPATWRRDLQRCRAGCPLGGKRAAASPATHAGPPTTPRAGMAAAPASPGDVTRAQSTTGTRNGKCWLPAECDVSIRPGWFWHESENDKVRTPQDLMNLYFESVGRGASFLLNVPPDKRGLIYESDAASLRKFGQIMNATFGKNLAHGARISASNVRGKDPAYSAANLTDESRSTYWATDDAVKTPTVTVELPRPATFNLVRLREYIHLGQRVDSFSVDAWQNGDWTAFGSGTSIGMGRILRSEKPVTTNRLRLRITAAAVCPALSELGVFLYEG